jgi:hypothetical protein
VGAREGVLPRAVAIVSWGSDRTRAHIEIGVRRQDGSHWITREVEFRDADPESERWRSVGLMIGTLVGESERKQKEEPVAPALKPPPAPAKKAQPRPSRVIATQREPTRVWIGIEALAGSGLDDGSLRYGGGLVAVWDMPLSPLLVSGSLRHLQRPRDGAGVVVRWSSAAIGSGVHAEPGSTLRLESRAEAVLERTEAAVDAERSDSGGLWTPGLRLSAAFGVEPVSGVVLLGGAELSAFPRGTRVILRGEESGRALPLTWTAQVGARFGF